MLIWRTQDLVKNFTDESSCALIKGQWTQHCITLRGVELLLLTHNCPTCLGDTQMSSRDTKKKSSPLVLHNTQLCMAAGRGRCQWSSQCLQVILFIIQMQTLFHYPWGSGSNVLMSLTHTHLLVWDDSTAPVHVTDDERQKADKGRQKQVITSYLHFYKGNSPQHPFFFIIRPTRPWSGEAFEDTHTLGLWLNLRCQADMKELHHLCPSLFLVLMLHAVKESPHRDPLPLCCSMWLII